MTPTIMVQALDANNDPIEGANGPVFLTDIDAVAQIISTTLKLLLGEWWENLTIGFGLYQYLLGSSASPKNQEAVMLLIEQTITSCPYVLQIVDFSFINSSQVRASFFTAQVSTYFGTLTVTNAPGAQAAIAGPQ